jgi:hypothetical protein
VSRKRDEAITRPAAEIQKSGRIPRAAAKALPSSGPMHAELKTET